MDCVPAFLRGDFAEKWHAEKSPKPAAPKPASSGIVLRRKKADTLGPDGQPVGHHEGAPAVEVKPAEPKVEPKVEHPPEPKVEAAPEPKVEAAPEPKVEIGRAHV